MPTKFAVWCDVDGDDWIEQRRDIMVADPNLGFVSVAEHDNLTAVRRNARAISANDNTVCRVRTEESEGLALVVAYDNGDLVEVISE